MHLGFTANLIACLLTAYSCMAISDDFGILTKSSFGSVTLTEVNGLFTDEITMDVGLRAIALDNPVNGVGQVVVNFNQFCELSTDGFQRYMPAEDCAQCQDISTNMVASVIISTVTYLPSFFTDILRMYSGYDVNCQKFFATGLATLTVLLSLNTILSYVLLCGDSFYEGVVPFDKDGTALPPGTPDDEVEFLVQFEWEWGWGLILLLAASCLKFLDVICNLCVPTPTVTRDRKEQQIYEKVQEEDFP
jgi:hypothetical protein